jgi:hypothetical protein
MRHFVVELLNNPVCLGVLCLALVMVPIIGIAKIHETSNEGRSKGND